jgi:hypothetical protein
LSQRLSSIANRAASVETRMWWSEMDSFSTQVPAHAVVLLRMR